MLSECSVKVPGKVIITGEHSVLQGCPAIAVACSLYIENNVRQNYSGKIIFISKVPIPANASALLDLAVSEFKERFELDGGVTMELSSTLPVGSGMGSSAAAAAAVFAGLCQLTENKLPASEMLEAIKICENLIHGTSSGLDPAAVIYGGMVRKSNSKILPKRIFLPIDFYIVNTGKPDCTTGEAVAHAKNLFTPELIRKFRTVSENIEANLEKGNSQALAKNIIENEKLLEAIGVVPEKIKSFAREAENSDMAFKISGAGSIRGDCGGIGLLFIEPKLDEQAKALCKKYGYSIEKVKIHTGGLPCLA